MKFTEPEARQFVAYTPPQRMEGPDGEAITAGSQTFVSYYKGIKVSDIKVGGYNATKGNKTIDPAEAKTVRVEFDPESVGLAHGIAANIAPDDPAVAVLQHAMDNDEAVNVAIESIRMHKHRETKELISPLTPIHALMGAETPGGKADMGKSGKTTSKVIAAVNGETTSDCRSDATQWAQLSSNRAGNLPPEGFRLLTDKEDWTKIGVIVPTDEYRAAASGQPSGAPVDINALADLIISHLDEKMAIENRRYISAPKSGEIAEGKPFSATTMHNWVNLGSYLNSKFRYNFEWAFDYLKEVTQNVPSDEDVLALVDQVIEIADRAQVLAYGGNVKTDQQATSHTEACRWTQWAISHRFTYTGNMTNEWKKNVCDYVVDKMTAGGVRIAKSVLGRDTVEPPAPKPRQSASSPSSPASPVSAPPAAQPSNEEKFKVLNNCLNAVNKNWNNMAELRRIYTHAASLPMGVLKAPVDMNDAGEVVFSKGSGKTLGDVIKDRGLALKNMVEHKDDPSTPVPAPREPEPTPEPEQQAPEPDDTPLDGDEFASLLGATTDSGDWSTKLAGITTQAEATVLWKNAQASLNESVQFRGETVKLSDAFQTISNEMGTAQEIAEEVANATSIAELNGLRTRAKKESLLDYEVEDGVSDDPLKLSDAILARRDALKNKATE